MSTSTAEKKHIIEFNQDYYKDQIQSLITPNILQFRKILQTYIAFNVISCILISSEIFYLFFHLTFLIQTFLFAINLALIFVTIFSYFTFKIYFQTRKTENCIEIKNAFLRTCKAYINYQEDQIQHPLIIAGACSQMAAALQGIEYSIYPVPKWLNFLSPSIEKLSCWTNWKDVHFIQELFLEAAIEEHLKLVRAEPTDLEVHAGLANAYVILSGLYVDPRTMEGLDEERWIPSTKYQEDFKRKFRLTAERAIEEFKILSHYAPHDPWVHSQLAYSYHDLQMPKEEIHEYETILQLCPDDRETLVKLGKLYFEQGMNAKGLQVYEKLKKANYKKAESLIHFYGSYSRYKA